MRDPIGWQYPLQFSFQTSYNERVLVEILLRGFKRDLPYLLQYCNNKEGLDIVWVKDDNWFEVVVGEFTMRKDDSPIYIEFSLV